MSLAAQVRRLMQHSYTRTPMLRTAGDEDSYYEATRSAGTPVEGVRCRYFEASTPHSDATGAIVVEAPTLSVDPADPLTIGDQVSDIRARDGTVLEAGPLEVLDVTVSAPFGVVAKRIAVLGASRTTG